MKKWIVVVSVALNIAVAPQLNAQSDSPVSFEVASIELRSPPPEGAFFIRLPSKVAFKISGNTVMDNNATLEELIIDAYDVKNDQINGIPEWGQAPRGDRYDIQAKAPGATPPAPAQVRRMLQSLLAERFQLKLHRETKDLPVYDLVVGKNGSKLKEVSPDSPPPGRYDAVSRGDMTRVTSLIGSYAKDRPVIDKTGLNGTYEYATSWLMSAVSKTSEDPAASIFTLLPENLGLQLVPAKAPVETLIIDHAEKPSEN